MNIDLAEPPLPTKVNAKKSKDKGSQTGIKTRPAASGFSRFESTFGKIKPILSSISNLPKNIWSNLSPKLQPIFSRIKDFYFKFSKANGLNKSLAYQLGLLIVLSMIPWISEASVSKQSYAALIRYSEPIDPIAAGQFERNFSQYSSPTMNVDPDKIVLAEMDKNDSYSLAQQLEVNANKTIDEPERQAPTYTVQNGETITQVAERFSLHVGTILDANNIQPEDLKKIKAGVVLKIPSSDTNTSDAWLVAINEAEERARAQAAAEAAAAAAKKKKQQQVATTRVNTGGLYDLTQQGGGGSYSSDVTVIGYSSEQCLPWAREQTGIQIHGYAGDVTPTQSEPRVGGIALDRFFGHASVVVGVGDGYIVVHEANYMRGRLTERRVSTSAIRGYVY